MTRSFIGFGYRQSCKPRLQYGAIPSSFSSREMLAYQREIMEVCEDNPFVIAFIRWPHVVLPLLAQDREVAAIMHHLLTPACSRPRSCSNRENYPTVTRQPRAASSGSPAINICQLCYRGQTTFIVISFPGDFALGR